MDAKEKKAFTNAFQNGVATVDRDVVEKFLEDYYSDEEHDGDDLYDKYGICYTSIVDAICIWDSSQEYAKKTQETT